MSHLPRNSKPEKTISARIIKTVHSVILNVKVLLKMGHIQFLPLSRKKIQAKRENKTKLKTRGRNSSTNEIGECQEFFAKSLTTRKQLAMRQNCFTCLGSFEGC